MRRINLLLLAGGLALYLGTGHNRPVLAGRAMKRRAPIRVYVYALVVALYVAIVVPAPTLLLGLLAFVANYAVAFWIAWAICYACDLYASRRR